MSNALLDLEPDEIVAIGQDLGDDLIELVRRRFPGAKILTLGETEDPRLHAAPRGVFEAMRAVQNLRPTAILVLQDFRKLKAIALAVPAQIRLVLRNGRWVRFGTVDFAIDQSKAVDEALLGSRVQDNLRKTERTVRRELWRWAGTPPGIANDYSFLEAELAKIPKVRVSASVVLPVYNRKDALRRTLAGLTRQTYPKELFEVIVADDGSDDHPDTVVAEFPSLALRVVHQEHKGFRAGRARNLGVRDAKNDVVVFLDSDMIPSPGLLAGVLRWFALPAEPPIVVIGGRRFIDATGLTVSAILSDFKNVERAPLAPAPSAVHSPDAQPDEDWRDPIIRRTDRLKKNAFAYRLAASGNLALRRSHALEVGLFDESYDRWGGEDVEFAFRLHRRGFYFIPEAQALAFHQDHPTSVPREADAEHTRKLTESLVPQGRRFRAGANFRAPKVSIIVPATGPSPHLPRAIDSALAQTWDDLELVVVLPLAEAGRVQAYANERRLHVVTEGGRREHAILLGAKMARGEHLLVLDPADELLPEALSILVPPLDKIPESSSVLGGIEIHDTAVGLLAHRGPHALRQPGLPGTSAHLIRARDFFRALRSGDPNEIETRGLAFWDRVMGHGWVRRSTELVVRCHVEAEPATRGSAARLRDAVRRARAQPLMTASLRSGDLRPLLRALAERF